MRDLPLSVLDLAPVTATGDTTEALGHTIELARRADELGYTRFWVAEHHGMPGIASSSPPVLIGAIAAATSRIRVGSGGVMLPNHAPLVVAEQFGTLAALHPGRIDIGIGRAPGTDPRTAAALRRDLTHERVDEFPQALGELGCFLINQFPAGHPYERLRAVPQATQTPPIWLLGSSLFSAELAGLLGLPFAYAHHFSAGGTLAALAKYRESFRPGAGTPAGTLFNRWGRALDTPYTMIAVQAVCAETDEAAHALALPAALSFLRLRQSRPGPIPTVEEAAAYPWTDLEREFVADRWAGQAIGSQATVAAALDRLLEATAVDELMLTTQVYDVKDRVRSIELVRSLFGDIPAGLQQV